MNCLRCESALFRLDDSIVSAELLVWSKSKDTRSRHSSSMCAIKERLPDYEYLGSD